MSVHDTLTGLPEAGQALTDALIFPLVAGWVVNTYLLGAFTHAFVSYLTVEKKRPDSRVVSSTLFSVLVLEYIYFAFSLEELFGYAGRQHRDVNTLVSGGFCFSFQPIVAGIISSTVQFFLAVRASKLFISRWKRLAFFVIIGLLVTCSLGGSMLVSALGFITYAKTNVDLPISYGAAVALWLWTSAAADVMLSVSLYFNLKSRLAGFNSTTDNSIKLLIKVALRTAAYTAIVALAGALTSVGIPFSSLLLTNVPCAFYLPLPALYAFSLFTTINSRTIITQQPSSDAPTQLRSGIAMNSLKPPCGLATSQTGVVPGIRIAREVEVELSERLTVEDMVWTDVGDVTESETDTLGMSMSPV